MRRDLVADLDRPRCAILCHQMAKAARETGVAFDLRRRPFEPNPQIAG